MILAEVFAWWYTAGWMRLFHNAAARTRAILQFFSMGILLETLFDPFRQIDAGKVHGSLEAELRAFGNRLFSRIVGFFVRTFTIVIGLVCVFLAGLVALAQLVLWPFLPAMPVIGLVMMFIGWTL